MADCRITEHVENEEILNQPENVQLLEAFTLIALFHVDGRHECKVISLVELVLTKEIKNKITKSIFFKKVNAGPKQIDNFLLFFYNKKGKKILITAITCK